MELKGRDKGRKAQEQTPEWRWGRTVAGRPGIGGGIAALFNNDGAEPPPGLKRLYLDYENRKEPAVRASMFAREAIANSWDSYHFSATKQPKFSISCTFGTHTGAEARKFRQSTDVVGLGEKLRTSDLSGRDVGLDAIGEAFIREDVGADISFLLFEESFGGGMGGSWKDNNSALDRALLKVGWAQARIGAGGSYGYGKAAVAQGSVINSLIVYTCFPEDKNEPGITRRLLGVTYWKPHSANGSDLTGWATYGELSDQGDPLPLENEEADRVAEALGIPLRDPNTAENLGSSILLINPSFDADDLRAAVLCNWWPALLHNRDQELHVFIQRDGEEKEEIQLDQPPSLLAPFTATYLGTDSETAQTHHLLTDVKDKVFGQLGQLELLSHTPESADETKSLIALIRDTDLVIQYYSPPGKPTVRGVFVADESINENLRQTEPKEHDKWMKTRAGDHRGSSEDYRIAKSVYNKIDDYVAAFRLEIQPVSKERLGDATFFRDFIEAPGATVGRGGRGAGGGPSGPKGRRRVHVHLVHPLDETDIDRPTRTQGALPGTLTAKAHVRFGLMEWVSDKTESVVITIGAQFVDDAGKTEMFKSTVTEPSKFKRISGPDETKHRFSGTLHKGTEVEFKVETDSYNDEWTVAIFFDAETIKTQESAE